MIDFSLSPIGINIQNIRVSQLDLAIYIGDVILLGDERDSTQVT